MCAKNTALQCVLHKLNHMLDFLLSLKKKRFSPKTWIQQHAKALLKIYQRAITFGMFVPFFREFQVIYQK